MLVALVPFLVNCLEANSYMKNSSWKTTAAGISAIVASVAGALNLMFDGNTLTNPDWTSVIAAVVAGFGLITARDNDKSSEDVSAK